MATAARCDALRRWLLPACVVSCLLPAAVAAQPAAHGSFTNDARGWIARVQGAASGRNYQGTMVFTAGGAVSSARVAHFFVGSQVYERIESLDGRQRQVFRHNDLVHTVWPQSGLAVIERRGAALAAPLPSSTQSVEPRALDQYDFRLEGRDRIAGRDAMVFELLPRDEWRFAQRVWADLETGLMLRSDVIARNRAVLESSAFSEVSIGVRAQPDSVLEPIRRLQALRVVQAPALRTDLAAHGWLMPHAVPGFRLASCLTRPMNLSAPSESDAGDAQVLQAVFTDGLTHVSLFVEPAIAARPRQELDAQFGATHSLVRRRDDHWITAMGEVPVATLRRFVDALERRR